MKKKDKVKKEGKCVTCAHLERAYHEFPCSECRVINPGEMFEMFVEEKEQEVSSIRDSGHRREFSTGAVRDMAEGKGRCDLLPLDVVGVFLGDQVLLSMDLYVSSGEIEHLFDVLECFVNMTYKNKATAMLEVSRHFEEGAKKYGEYNWQKGLPVSCYVDSAVRHYLKCLRGDVDEPHDRAFLWNVLCLIWTEYHIPGEKGENDGEL